MSQAVLVERRFLFELRSRDLEMTITAGPEYLDVIRQMPEALPVVRDAHTGETFPLAGPVPRHREEVV